MLSQPNPEAPEALQTVATAGAAKGIHLALARYRFTAVFERDLVLPPFAGALLRSVFGLALRQGACVTGAPRCAGCPLLNTCAYPAVFETPAQATQLHAKPIQVPNPCVMEAPGLGATHYTAGQPLTWHQVLVGAPTLARLPLLATAWERSLRNGWGPERVQGRLLELAVVDAQGQATPAQRPPSERQPAHGTGWVLHTAPTDSPRAATLHFNSPCRLQHDGRPLRPGELSPRKLVADLLRRCNLMLDMHLGISPAPFDAPALVAHAQTLTDDRSALQWRDDTRYSARQGKETPLGGVVGRWTLQGDLAPLLPWLQLGQWLHLGKGATMGMGAYRLETPA